MSVGLQLTGQGPRRGLTRRPVGPGQLAPEIADWLRAEAPDVVRRVDRDDTDPASVLIRASFHPAAADVEVRLGAAGLITVLAPTSEVGPGYHTWVSRLLRRLGAAHSIQWRAARSDVPPEDPTGYFRSDDPAAAQRGLLRWLHGELRRIAEARGRRHPPLHLGSFPGHQFEADAVLVTPLGPRSEAWLAGALRSPRAAVDVWPWATDAMDGRYLLERALCLLWTEVRWRPPATPEEREVIEEVLRLLRKALPLDPSLAYPWPEWRELLRHAGVSDPLVDRVATEARAAPERAPIGYRRHAVTVLHEGWQLRVPGSWAEAREGATWRGGEGGRMVEVTVSRLGVPGSPDTPGAYLQGHAGDLGSDALSHRAGPLVGRGRVSVDSSSGVEVATLEGWSAVPGLGAAVRIEFHDPDDWEWALDLWRSLVPVPSGTATSTRPV